MSPRRPGADTLPAPRVSRPVGRRILSRLRSGVNRLATVVERAGFATSDELMPPAHLRIYYYRTWRREAFIRACQSIATEAITQGLRPEHRVLDIGSGIGNLAIGLRTYLHGSYDGLEIHPEAVAWCQQAITSRMPGFRFHRADVASGAYNPRGAVSATSYRFPFDDGMFDFIFVGSVFTHMLPDGVEHYVREMARVLAPNGRAVASYFLLDQESRAGVDGKLSFMSFDVEHPSGVCRLHDAAVPEAAVAFDETFVRQLHAAAGLEVADVRRGGWWSGRADDQDVVTAVPVKTG